MIFCYNYKQLSKIIQPLPKFKFMKFWSPRTYTTSVGLLLFAVGVFGFAFRSMSRLPDIYMFTALVLGFWGLLVSFNAKR